MCSSGHWLMEESPAYTMTAIRKFVDSTKASEKLIEIPVAVLFSISNRNRSDVPFGVAFRRPKISLAL